jgi:hypothetical protein
MRISIVLAGLGLALSFTLACESSPTAVSTVTTIPDVSPQATLSVVRQQELPPGLCFGNIHIGDSHTPNWTLDGSTSGSTNCSIGSVKRVRIYGTLSGGYTLDEDSAGPYPRSDGTHWYRQPSRKPSQVGVRKVPCRRDAELRLAQCHERPSRIHEC